MGDEHLNGFPDPSEKMANDVSQAFGSWSRDGERKNRLLTVLDMHANMLTEDMAEQKKKEWGNEKKWEFSFLVQTEKLIKMLKSDFFAQGF